MTSWISKPNKTNKIMRMEICHAPEYRYPATYFRRIGVQRRCSIQISLKLNDYKTSSSTSTNTNMQYDDVPLKSESYKNRIFILGMGYVGNFFAQELIDQSFCQVSQQGGCRSSWGINIRWYKKNVPSKICQTSSNAEDSTRGSTMSFPIIMNNLISLLMQVYMLTHKMWSIYLNWGQDWVSYKNLARWCYLRSNVIDFEGVQLNLCICTWQWWHMVVGT